MVDVQKTIDEVEPVAYSYELAHTKLVNSGPGEGYAGWRRYLTERRPNVPEGSVRNLTPLYKAPPTPAGSFDEIVAAILRVPIRFIDDPKGGLLDELPVYIKKHQAENFAHEILKPTVDIKEPSSGT